MCQKNEIFIIKKKFKFIQKKINFYGIPLYKLFQFFKFNYKK